MLDFIKNPPIRSGPIILGAIFIAGFLILILNPQNIPLNEAKLEIPKAYARVNCQDSDGDGFNLIAAECPICDTLECDADDNTVCVSPFAPEGQCVVSEEECRFLWSEQQCQDFSNNLCELYENYLGVNDLSEACPQYEQIPAGSATYYFGCNDELDNNQNLNIDTQEFSCPKPAGLAVCGRYTDDPNTPEIDESEPCGFCHFFLLFDRIINWVVGRIIPIIAVLLLIIGGLAIATSRGNQAQLSKGKQIIIWTFAGYAVILIGWMLLNSLFSGIGAKTWTGITSEKIVLQKTYGTLLWTPEANLDVERNELEGLALTITGTGNAALDGQSRRIVKVWDENDDASGPLNKNCPDGDEGDLTGAPTGADTKDCIEIDKPLPNVSNANGAIKIGGWWQFSCGQ